jgi:predicted enzyme related to lactoylglutathione lyase
MSVTGIGGFFFRVADVDRSTAWYAEHLGITGEYGMWSQEAGPTVFAPFPRDTDYFPADRSAMLNFRVRDLDALLAKLRAAGIDVVTDPEWDTPETGRFARITDPDGNPLELWEPPAD